jgi:cytidylate kinase
LEQAPANDAPVVAIDGPSGSGKGTVARLLARRSGWHLLDSGALYRLVAIAGNLAGLGSEDVGEREVSDELRTQAAAAGASRVAAWPAVRAALLERQHAFARPPGLIADGRDMGTIVFPRAPLKIFLTATPEERARRRYKQLKDKDSSVTLAGLSLEIAERDRRDRMRPVAPLVPAADALILDSTALDAAEVAEQIYAHGRSRLLWP